MTWVRARHLSLGRCLSTTRALASDLVEAEAKLTPEAITQILRTRSVSDSQHIQISPDVESQLNAEFQQFVKDFALETDLRAEMLKLADRTSAQGSRSLALGPTISTRSAITGRQTFPNLKQSPAGGFYTPQELFVRHLFHASRSNRLGGQVKDVYRPHETTTNPPTAREMSVSALLAAGAHLGHATARLRPSTQPYIYGVRDGIHIIDLDHTLTHLRRAAKVAEGVAKHGGLVLFVGTRQGQERPLQMAAKRAGGYYVHTRWVPGTLSNASEMSGNWDRVEVDMADQPTGRRISPNLKRTVVKPDLVVILNPIENRNVIRECLSSKIPTIAVIDTDSEPSLVTYPIPANDDSLRTSELILGVLSRACEKGRRLRHAEFMSYQTEAERQEPVKEQSQAEHST